MSDSIMRDRQKFRTPESVRQKFPALPILESATPVARVFFAYFGLNGHSCKARSSQFTVHSSQSEDTPRDGSGAGPQMATGPQAAPEIISADQFGSSEVPHFRTALANPEKFEFLAITLALTMSRAIAQHNFSEAATDDAWQREMAEVLGITRQTFTARMSNFCQPHTWQNPNPPAPSAHDRGPTPGRRLKRRRGPGIFQRVRRCYKPLYYKLQIPSVTNSPTQWIPRSLKTLCRDPESGHLWDAGKIGVAGFKGFKDVPTWIWHPALEISEIARILLTAYWLMGLGDYGYVTRYQAYVADYIGVSMPTVRAANQELERAGLVRVAHQTHEAPHGGWLPEGPVKIIWVPGVILSKEEADLELTRLRATRDKFIPDPIIMRSFDNAMKLAQELLQGAVGKQRRISSFRNEFRAKLAFHQFPRGMIEKICPETG